MSRLGDVLPCPIHDDAIGSLAVYSVLPSQCYSSISHRTGDIFASHRSHNVIGKLSMWMCCSAKGSISLGAVPHVVGMGSLNYMARIDTVPNVAGMSRLWSRPPIMRQEEGQAMNSCLLPFKSTTPIPIFFEGKRVKNALIGGIEYSTNNPVVSGVNIRSRHRCSSKASVLGGNALTSVSPF